MATLSQAQIAMYAQSAGLPADKARTAAAIAMAESSGRTEAYNGRGLDRSYGLWQINMIEPMGAARRKRLGISSNTALYDPATNARAMAMISSGGRSFSAWTTYTSGKHKKFLTASTSGTAQTGLLDPPWWVPLIPGIPGVPGEPSSPDLGLPGLDDVPGLSGLSALAELGIGMAKWMADPHNWLRVAQVIVGGGLVYVGIAMALGKGARPAVAQLVQATPISKIKTAGVRAA